MKRFHTLIGIFLSFTLMTLISGCGGGGGTTSADTGTVSLRLTDAPIDDEDVQGVFVTFTGLRYQYADANDSWQDVDLNESRTVDLLKLQDGNTTLLNEVELPAGEIAHVRFVLDLDNCYITFNDETNTSLELEVPSGAQTGYKAIGGFTIPAGGTVNVTADFDVRKSVTATGNGRYKLNPTIKIIDNIEVGEINGTMTLDANGSKVIVYAYEDGTFDEGETNATSNFANSVLSTDATDGTYVMPWLTTGVYDLIVVATDNTGVFENILGYINNVSVEAGITTPQDITDDTLEDALL